MRLLLKSFKSFLFLSILVVTACASPPAGVAYDLPAKNKFAHCPYQHFVGRDVSDAKKELEKSHQTFRLLEPDSQMTMDFNEERVNVVFNPSSKQVERVFCG